MLTLPGAPEAHGRARAVTLAAVLALLLSPLSACGPGGEHGEAQAGPLQSWEHSSQTAMKAAVAALPDAEDEVAAFYRARHYRPLWFHGNRPRPAAAKAQRLLSSAGADGLDPARYRIDASPGATGRSDHDAIARYDVALSSAFARYVRNLRHGARDGIVYVDRDLVPVTPDQGAVLAAAAAAPSLEAYVGEAARLNPFYDGLRQAQGHPVGAAFGGVTSGEAPAPGFQPVGFEPNDRGETRRIRINLERARALPAGLGERYIWVDVPAQRLLLVEHGRVVDRMRVIVGRPDAQTPVMAARIRFVIRHPYWNLPPDLAAKRAQRVLREGPDFLTQQHLEMLSGWGKDARMLTPSQVDWQAVAEGKVKLRMRQRPGPDNMMGAIKFMLPNHLGIYLHDTPNKANFRRADRMLSSGCVRVEYPERVARFLFAGTPPQGNGTPEERIDLPQPVPVYITYFTIVPTRQGLWSRRDIYGRDRGTTAL